MSPSMRHIVYALDQARGCYGDELGCFVEELAKLLPDNQRRALNDKWHEIYVRTPRPRSEHQPQPRPVDYIVVSGSAFGGGFAINGPFATNADAVKWADEYDCAPYEVVKVDKP